MKKIFVISLGGSLIIPDKVDISFLKKFRKILRKNYKNYKFVIVCGGGSVARKYIEAIRKETNSERAISEAGIRATRMNALLVMQLFGKEANDVLPKDMQDIKNDLAKNKVAICGALRYTPNSTSDSTAAKLAHFLNAKFINITNVNGLYTSNPQENKNAKLIPNISWKNFEKIAHKIKFKAGQHFVLDQQASSIIEEHKIPTYIIGPNLQNISNILKGKKFKGTLIKN